VITGSAFAGKTYGVYGLARSGRATVDALTASGATCLNGDDGDAARAAFNGPLTNLHETDLAGLEAFIVSPGVPHSVPLIVRAKAADVPVIGDIELFAQARAALPPHRVVGITGTNGKSTTTALIHHILAQAGRPTSMGGNIGLPILAQVPYLASEEDGRRRSIQKFAWIGVAIFAIVVLLVIVHFAVTPLDVMFYSFI
jgi:UDP-N-acetylmuramoylalanine--D-glutamate ligase